MAPRQLRLALAIVEWLLSQPYQPERRARLGRLHTRLCRALRPA